MKFVFTVTQTRWPSQKLRVSVIRFKKLLAIERSSEVPARRDHRCLTRSPGSDSVKCIFATLYGNTVRILFVASEGLPFSKTGGFADVVEALPKALVAQATK